MPKEHKPVVIKNLYPQKSLASSKIRHALTSQPSPRYEDSYKKEKADNNLSDWDEDEELEKTQPIFNSRDRTSLLSNVFNGRAAGNKRAPSLPVRASDVVVEDWD